MIQVKDVPHKFWAEVMNKACYIINQVTLRPDIDKTCHEVSNGKTLNVKCFHVFGSPCLYQHKLDPRSDEGMFLGYSTSSKAYQVYNHRTKIIMESLSVVVKDATKHDDGSSSLPITTRHVGNESTPVETTVPQSTDAPPEANDTESDDEEHTSLMKMHLLLQFRKHLRRFRRIIHLQKSLEM